MESNNKIKVTLVDDSSVIRGALTKILNTDPNIEIIGSLSNGEAAVNSVKKDKPDVMILDIEMPVMDGITALPKILQDSPETKVIMFSSLTAEGADVTMQALSLGAIECIVKPSSDQDTGPGSEFHRRLLKLVNILGSKQNEYVEDSRFEAPRKDAKPETPIVSVVEPVAKIPAAAPVADWVTKADSEVYTGKPDIIAIGSSTGGPQALFKVLKDIGKVGVPIVITQHMPATFTKILAEHISQNTGLPAQEGSDGMVLQPGEVYVAPGGKHMLFSRDGFQLKIKLDDGPAENFCKPAVDPMLRSLMEIYDKRILCLILTGMGSDGLQSCKTLAEKGGRIIAQDKETSVVWGMPGAVTGAGICNKVLPVDEIGSLVKSIVQ